MERNTFIGVVLLFVLFYIWSTINAPTEAEIAEQKRIQDSLKLSQTEQVLSQEEQDQIQSSNPTSITQNNPVDSAAQSTFLTQKYGPAAGLMSGSEELFTLENELMKVSFTSKGAKIKQVELKTENKITEDENGVRSNGPVILMEDEKNVFNYELPFNNASERVGTKDLYFSGAKRGNRVEFTAKMNNGGSIVQTYELKPQTNEDGTTEVGYLIDYDVSFNGLDNSFKSGTEHIKLQWDSYLDRIELSPYYESWYSTVYFKPSDDDFSYCNCRMDDQDEVDERLKWVSHSNQYYNATLITEDHFSSGVFETIGLEDEDSDLKFVKSEILIPFDKNKFNMSFYTGPNEFDRLRAAGNNLEDIIPYGWSLFGTVNRWVVRPAFDLLSTLISSKGLVIILLTLIIKMLLFPLMYKMLHSQAKMGALKPKLAHLKEKFKDEPQKMQMENMKIYREYGVSPLGGCLPMVIQMPIWIALYRFFPASIEFRQKSFWWADDLSAFDAFINLPFEIPYFGAHISLFTVLWAITTVIYTYYNSKMTDMNSINPMMKYMQYFMPIMFLGFFNTYASGLTCYLFFSSLINILQIVGAKRFLFDNDKILAELEEKKKNKPAKKKSGFQARLEAAMAEQQRQQAKNKKKK